MFALVRLRWQGKSKIPIIAGLNHSREPRCNGLVRGGLRSNQIQDEREPSGELAGSLTTWLPLLKGDEQAEKLVGIAFPGLIVGFWHLVLGISESAELLFDH